MSQILPTTHALLLFVSGHFDLVLLVAVAIYGFRRFVGLRPSVRRDVIDLVKAFRRG